MNDIRDNGSCWDEGPQFRRPGECAPMPPRCELHAGHLGAHRSGPTQWMRNPSSYAQVTRERDEALANLARARECIEAVREAVGDVTEQWKPLVIADAIAEYEKGSSDV